MPPWLIWVFLGVVALAGESISMALFLLYVGIAAFVAAILSLVGLALAAQVGVFVALSVLLIALVRPRMLQALVGRVPHRALTNQGDLVDKAATVTQTITEGSGAIRLGTAEFWTARPVPPFQRIEEGADVRIAYVSGLTAYVAPLGSNLQPPSAPGAAATGELAREES